GSGAWANKPRGTSAGIVCARQLITGREQRLPRVVSAGAQDDCKDRAARRHKLRARSTTSLSLRTLREEQLALTRSSRVMPQGRARAAAWAGCIFHPAGVILASFETNEIARVGKALAPARPHSLCPRR